MEQNSIGHHGHREIFNNKSYIPILQFQIKSNNGYHKTVFKIPLKNTVSHNLFSSNWMRLKFVWILTQS